MFDPKDVDFPSTHWTLVGETCRGTPEQRRAALDKLLRRYIKPLTAFVRAVRRLESNEAEEVVQEFIVSNVVEKGLIEAADRHRGKFREFIKMAVINSARMQRRSARSLKRGGGEVRSLDEVGEPGGAEDASAKLFEHEWARAVINEAAARMRRHCEKTEQLNIWHIFEARVLGPTLGQVELVSYHELVERLGLESPEQASNVLMTAKRMYVRSLRAVVGEYALGEQAIEEEIADLRRVLGG